MSSSFDPAPAAFLLADTVRLANAQPATVEFEVAFELARDIGPDEPFDVGGRRMRFTSVASARPSNSGPKRGEHRLIKDNHSLF
jgi:hypothetical protein